MEKPTVTIMGLTYMRKDVTEKVYTNNLKNAGYDYELMVCDNGHRNDDAYEHDSPVKFIESLKPNYFRKNTYNEGIARALNQMIIRSKADLVFFMPSDIILPNNWLKIMVEYATDIPQSGIIGFEGQDLKLPLQNFETKQGTNKMVNCQTKIVLDGCQIFGATMITRNLINTIGYFCEDYLLFGFEDSDYCFRSQIAGFRNYYIPGLKSEHIANDSDSGSLYRQEKDFALWGNAGMHRWRMHNYGRIGLYVPPPMLRNDML